MSMLKSELYVCYNCKAESLKTTVYSYSMIKSLIYRTDGYCTNHPVYTDRELVMWCPHCEKFLIASKLKRGKEITKVERGKRTNKSFISIFDIEKKYFPRSKKWNEAWDKSKTSREEEIPDELRWFSSLDSCREILFALKSPELKNLHKIRYQLRLNYWRINNHDDYGFEDDPQATPMIYKKLMKAWEGKTDERYLFKAEMLRNMGKFKESNELLKNPLVLYIPVLKKYKKWAKVIKTLNGLKYKKSFEINI